MYFRFDINSTEPTCMDIWSESVFNDIKTSVAKTNDHCIIFSKSPLDSNYNVIYNSQYDDNNIRSYSTIKDMITIENALIKYKALK